MFRKMRREKNEIPAEEVKALLRQNKRAAFSVIGEDGYPYTVPINFYYDEPENRIYFHSAKAGHKLDAIRSDSRVCFTTWDEGYRKEGDWAYYVSSAVVFGRAVPVEGRALTEEKLRIFAQKYYPSQEELEDQLQRGIDRVQMIAIDIEHMTGKRVHEK